MRLRLGCANGLADGGDSGGTCANPELTPKQLVADDRGPLGQCLELGKGELARDVFHAAIGGRDQPLGRQKAPQLQVRYIKSV